VGKVSFNISMSLDGYINGPDVTPEQGLGRGGELLHEWVFNGTLFEEGEQAQLELVEVVDTPLATHLRYRVPA